MKTVWIINQYASTPEYGYAGRHYYLGKELSRKGYNVYLIASAKHHLLREKVIMKSGFKIENHNGLKMVWINMPEYVDAHSKQRVLNWFIFCIKLLQVSKVISDKPDSVVCSSPSLVSFLATQKIASKFGARLVFDVRDIWPLTLTDIGGYSVKHPFIRFLQWVENKAYRESDVVVSNLKNAVEHMAEHGLSREKYRWIPNGFAKDEVTNSKPLPFDLEGKIPKGKFIVGYTGTFGLANDLYTVLAAAKRLEKYSDVLFFLVGGGKEEADLKGYVKENKLNNVTFLGFVEKQRVQSVLARFDTLVVGAKKEPMYRFGVSPNKLFDYLISGKPIVYHIDSGDYHPIKDAGCGFEIEPGRADELAEAILKLYQMPAHEREALGENGRKAALEQYEYGQLAEHLAQVLFDN
ncbi:glycosyltransferase family 4 protein [Oceanisphaera sp. KMM 10153]|uniref:glycosyltransferase family 4 protein n=1 Tax=Oceanisphaera submarina TaxID=3390193 RepID=UPI003974A258